MTALRLARAFTHRTRVIKFAGGYHGHADPFLAEAGSGLATLGIPASPGVPQSVVADTVVVDYNDVDQVAAAVERHGEDLAAIFVEPVAGNMGCVPPVPGFLEALRALCDASGALLVFDEVITGFRVARGGAQAALRGQARPDDPRQDRRRRPAARRVRRPRRRDGAPGPVRRRLPGRNAVGKSARDRGGPLRAPPPAGRIGLRRARAPRRPARGRPRPVRPRPEGRRDAHPLRCPHRDIAPGYWRRRRRQQLDTDRYGELFRHLLDRGIYVAPTQFEAAFVSLAHGDEEIDRTIAAVASSPESPDASCAREPCRPSGPGHVSHGPVLGLCWDPRRSPPSPPRRGFSQ